MMGAMALKEARSPFAGWAWNRFRGAPQSGGGGGALFFLRKPVFFFFQPGGGPGVLAGDDSRCPVLRGGMPVISSPHDG